MGGPSEAILVEVGPRDGFQPIGPQLPTEKKIDFIRRLHVAGIRRMEVTAFVSARAVPQLSDSAVVLSAAQQLSGLQSQVLVPNQRYCEKAVAAGATLVAFVLSVSDKHNINNVRCTTRESIEEYKRLAGALPAAVAMRLNLSTAFHCPFDGSIASERVIRLLDELVPILPRAEIALCDTTGCTTPSQVGPLFDQVVSRYSGGPRWAFHGHDTYGLGVANVLAAHAAGVGIFDTSFAGLGGCPFAPGATGNVATEDVVWTFDQMGVTTGVSLELLLVVAEDAAIIPGALPGGRVRNALHSKRCVPASARR